MHILNTSVTQYSLRNYTINQHVHKLDNSLRRSPQVFISSTVPEGRVLFDSSIVMQHKTIVRPRISGFKPAHFVPLNCRNIYFDLYYFIIQVLLLKMFKTVLMLQYFLHSFCGLRGSFL